LTTYEGLFVFPERLQDQEIEEARQSVVADLERYGAKLLGSRTLGRRTFARPIKKMRAGVYVRMVFEINGQEIAALRQRLKLNDTLIRAQITVGDEQSLAWVQEPVGEEGQ